MSSPAKQTTSSAAKSDDQAASGISLLGSVAKSFKAAGLAAVVWCWGYMGFSVGWLYVALFFHIMNEEYRKIKDSKKAFALHSLADEKEAILSKLDEYPSWVGLQQACRMATFCFLSHYILLFIVFM